MKITSYFVQVMAVTAMLCEAWLASQNWTDRWYWTAFFNGSLIVVNAAVFRLQFWIRRRI